MRRSIAALTGLRFVAAFCVLCSHSIAQLVPFPNGGPVWKFVLSYLMVIGMPLFFVLSGFVMQYNYAEQITTRTGIYQFFVARFARLYPLYIGCIAFDLASSWGYGQLPAATPDALPYYLTLSQSWVYPFFGNTTLLGIFGWTSVTWSISTEFFFYLSFPLICLGTARLRSPRAIGVAITVLTVAGLVLVAVLGTFWSAIDDFGVRHFTPLMAEQPQDLFWWILAVSPYVRLLEFILGCLCAALIAALARVPVSAWEQRLGAFLTWSAVALTVVIYGLALAPIPWAWLRGLRICFGFAPSVALLIFCCARYRNGIVLALSAPLLVLGGEASYSLYLLHYPLIEAFMHTVRPVTSRGIEIADILQWFLMMGSAIGLSLVTWRLFEIPARRWLRTAMSPAKRKVMEVPDAQLALRRSDPSVATGADRNRDADQLAFFSSR
jgi:peptidoglycan/LPS O-acetylase OafA/YrhL